MMDGYDHQQNLQLIQRKKDISKCRTEHIYVGHLMLDVIQIEKQMYSTRRVRHRYYYIYQHYSCSTK